MNKKPHPHADMLRAIADDESLADRIQSLDYYSKRYISCPAHELLSAPDETYRIKPREFKEGYFYPVRFKLGSTSTFVFEYTSTGFKAANGLLYNQDNFKCIGEGFLPDFGGNYEN